MKNNPKRKTDRTGNADRTDKTVKTSTKARAGIGQKGDTAYDRLNKPLNLMKKSL